MSQKAYSKRIRETKNGKLIVRKPGGNHFNAKESRSMQLDRKRGQSFSMPRKSVRFMRNTK